MNANRQISPVVDPIGDIRAGTDCERPIYRRVLVGGEGHGRWRSSLLELLSLRATGVNR